MIDKRIMLLLVGVAIAADLILYLDRDANRWRLSHAALVAFLGAVAFAALGNSTGFERRYDDIAHRLERIEFKSFISPKGK